MSVPEKIFRLKGKTLVCIDWANVYGWRTSLKREIDAHALYEYLKHYNEIKEIRLYHGTDTHPKSVAFLKDAEQLGYSVVTKPVKYISAGNEMGNKITLRKCDFDMEACIDVHRAVRDGFDSFIFFTGDGDYEPLYKMLIALGKQVIVVYAPGHLGREIWNIEKGLFKIQIKHLMSLA